MKREFMIDRQGKTFVLYSGLLDLAHEKGLQSLATEVITVTATMAMFKATATFSDGRVFTGHGDATPENVGRNIAPHFVRMGETRAKARALRDALNIGAASLEELGDDDAPQTVERHQQPRHQPEPVQRTTRTEAAPARPVAQGATGASPAPASATPPPSANLAALRKRAEDAFASIRDLGAGPPPMLPPASASESDLLAYVEDATAIFLEKRKTARAAAR